MQNNTNTYYTIQRNTIQNDTILYNTTQLFGHAAWHEDREMQTATTYITTVGDPEQKQPAWLFDN